MARRLAYLALAVALMVFWGALYLFVKGVVGVLRDALGGLG